MNFTQSYFFSAILIVTVNDEVSEEKIVPLLIVKREISQTNGVHLKTSIEVDTLR